MHIKRFLLHENDTAPISDLDKQIIQRRYTFKGDILPPHNNIYYWVGEENVKKKITFCNNF